MELLTFDFNEYCEDVFVELDKIEPYWRDYLDIDDVIDWLTEAWPFPANWHRDPAAAARYCLADMGGEAEIDDGYVSMSSLR